LLDDGAGQRVGEGAHRQGEFHFGAFADLAGIIINLQAQQNLRPGPGVGRQVLINLGFAVAGSGLRQR